jgi:hypothetical protein
MDHFAGLDVSVKETSICIVDDAGKIVREVKVAQACRRLFHRVSFMPGAVITTTGNYRTLSS